MGYGKELKRILDEKNMKIAELARLTNIHPTTLYSAITRDSSIRYDYALIIADILQIAPEKICGTIPKKESNPSQSIQALIEIFNTLDGNNKDLLLSYAYALNQKKL